MINCPKCKRENVEHATFCYRCYTRLKTPDLKEGGPSLTPVPPSAEKRPMSEYISLAMGKAKEFGKEAGRKAETLARLKGPARRGWNRSLEYFFRLVRKGQGILTKGPRRRKGEPKRIVRLRSKEELQRMSRIEPPSLPEGEPRRIAQEGPHRVSQEEPREPSAEEPKPKAGQEPRKIQEGTQGVWMTVGGFSYKVLKSEWVQTLSARKVLDRKPDASFLSVLLTVRNDGKAPMTIPSFGLIDEGEAEYETFEKGWLIDNWLGRLERINPGVERSGVIIFDVPQAHRYRLKVLGGLWSQEYALIELQI